MTYSVKEIFYSIQGEGHNAGRAAVFCRFSGCNMWSGREADKLGSACPFCDTDFVGGAKYSEYDLINAITSAWTGFGVPYVIFTGGEPALQLTSSLLGRLSRLMVDVAVETNGSRVLPDGNHWVTVSPKKPDFVVRKGHELKLLYPLPGLPPESVSGLDFSCFSLQPITGPGYADNLAKAIAYCLVHPQWKLSTQNHKVWGVR